MFTARAPQRCSAEYGERSIHSQPHSSTLPNEPINFPRKAVLSWMLRMLSGRFIGSPTPQRGSMRTSELEGRVARHGDSEIQIAGGKDSPKRRIALQYFGSGPRSRCLVRHDANGSRNRSVNHSTNFLHRCTLTRTNDHRSRTNHLY